MLRLPKIDILWVIGGLALAMFIYGCLPSSAADVNRAALPAPVVRKAVVAPPVPTWTGFFLGVTGGAGIERTKVSSGPTVFALGYPSEGSFHNNGWSIGGELDARYQAGSLVFGLDGMLLWADSRGGNGGCIGPIAVHCGVKNSFFGWVGGELGLSSVGGQTAAPYNPLSLPSIALPIGNAKISALAGAAFRDFEADFSFAGVSAKERHTIVGFAPGAAFDVAVTPSISFGARWIHPFWQGNSCSSALTVLNAKAVNCSFKEKEDLFLLNLSYHLPVF